MPSRGRAVLMRGAQGRWRIPLREQLPIAREPGVPAVKEWSACIVSIAASRDRAQFKVLFAHFAPRLKGYFMRLGVSPDIAEDLAQDALLAVWRKAEMVDPARASASTWIFTIARNLRVDMQRRARDPRQLTDGTDSAPEPMPSDIIL